MLGNSELFADPFEDYWLNSLANEPSVELLNLEPNITQVIYPIYVVGC